MNANGNSEVVLAEIGQVRPVIAGMPRGHNKFEQQSVVLPAMFFNHLPKMSSLLHDLECAGLDPLFLGLFGDEVTATIPSIVNLLDDARRVLGGMNVPSRVLY